MFRNRDDAGLRLARKLWKYRGARDAVVLGIARGGVIVASSLGRSLDLPVGVFIAHKLGSPENPELAIGALTETGELLFNQELIEELGVTPETLAREIERQRRETLERRRMYRNGEPLPDVRGKLVILADDGVATGETFIASAKSLRALGPKRLIAAIPVGPPSALDEIKRLVDELCILEEPPDLGAVGRFYEEFGTVPHEEVTRRLKAG